MAGHVCFEYLVLALAATTATLAGHAHARSDPCTVPARTEAGWVCGQQRYADDGTTYASFRGVPYAKAPLGERRFKELEPLDAWDNLRDATNEGPICYQTDILYGKIMQPRGMSEDCIYANIHVPYDALPKNGWRPTRELQPPIQTADESEEVSREAASSGLPILVFIHGGGFAFGSGDSDLHGPEYLVSKNVIVITFNYRLNVFGFLSLNTAQVPGNTGLRDIVTLLRWVQKNAKNFGGDPDNVTLAGQSAGAIAAHLVTISKAAEGLFKRTIAMSGTATSSFYSPTPYYAQFMKKQLLTVLNITATDADEVYRQLIDLPAQKLVDANQIIIEQTGFTTFVPTVETAFPGVTAILDDYPDVLLANGRGNNIPIIIGYTDSECETFRPRLEKFDIVAKTKTNPFIIIPPKILFSTPPSALADVAKKIDGKYYNGTITVDGFVNACTDGFFEYPVLKLVEDYGKTRTAPMYVYKFTYEGVLNIFKRVATKKYHGAAHIEDLIYVFKTNSLAGFRKSGLPTSEDENMKNFMVKFFVNFMTCSKPICDVSDPIWPEATTDQFRYEDIHMPYVYQVKGISTKQQEITKFYDTLMSVE